MIDVNFWKKIIKNWVREDDRIIIPDDKKQEFLKAMEINVDDEKIYEDASGDEIRDILSGLELD